MKQQTEIPAGEVARQKEIMAQIRAMNEAAYARGKPQKYYYVLAMGCQMSAHDAEKLSGMLHEMGYEETTDEKKADFVLYNTCCVRENAELKVYGKLGYLKHYKEQNPEMIIGLCGCMMQQETVLQTLRKSYRHVDLVFGTFNLYKLPELLMTRLETQKPVYDIWQSHGEIAEDLPQIRQHSYKASVNIMYGCNNFCTYCIVPYVRGRERSREAEDILREIRNLVADGVKEVTLLGQNVNSYGKNLDNPISFAQLLRMVNEVEGLERIRFMTSHPKDLSDELIAAMAECEKVCPSLHLPFQSGSSRILEKMNRRYTKEHYLGLLEKVRAAIPDVTLSTDIIVGFPGETEEDFQGTLDVVRAGRFSNAFTFLYSKRTGTPAAIMEDQVEESVAKDRFRRLLDTVNPIVHDCHAAMVGTVQKVLVEEMSRRGTMTGRTPGSMLVHFPGEEDLIGQIIDVKITDNQSFYLIGERI